MSLLGNHEKAMIDSHLDNVARELQERETSTLAKIFSEIDRLERKINQLKTLNVNVAWGHHIEPGDKILITTIAQYDEQLATDMSQTVREFFGEGIQVLFVWGATATVESQSGL